MEFRLSPHEEALRAEVCAWLTAELGTTHDSDPEPMPPGYMPSRDFELKMGETGWPAISWPEEYGGGRPAHTWLGAARARASVGQGRLLKCVSERE